MGKLGDRIENALNETRILLLGGQVLVGFSYRICFEQGFYHIPFIARMAEVTGLGVMTAGLGWLVWPAAFHQIARQGRETASIHSFTTRVLDWALLPFAAGLGLTFYPVSWALRLGHPAWIGAAAAVFALAMWYSWFWARSDGEKRRKVQVDIQQEEQGGAKKGKEEIAERIKKLLIECRMALPGAQAFLGFQLMIVFAETFSSLPRSSQWIHFASLLATTVSIVLLIAVAAYHRMAEGGEDTEHFHTVGRRFLLIALVFLAPGMTGDLMVVLRLVSGSFNVSAIVAALLLLVFYGLWFGVSFWRGKATS